MPPLIRGHKVNLSGVLHSRETRYSEYLFFESLIYEILIVITTSVLFRITSIMDIL
jgi:hypothetical protein